MYVPIEQMIEAIMVMVYMNPAIFWPNIISAIPPMIKLETYEYISAKTGTRMNPSIINIIFACCLSLWSMNYIDYPSLVKST